MAAATALWLQAAAAAPCAPWLVLAGSPQQLHQQQLGPLGPAPVQQHWSSSSEEEVLIAACSRLCGAGRVSDAVDALQSAVHHRAGGVVATTNNNNHLFYRLINACQARKDLALGRRVHALAAASGLDGDSFLATHLIAMYGAQWEVDAAVQAFDAVARPSAQNWAAVIFACARHGQAARGVALYARMRRERAAAGGDAEPDARVFVAALKACAVARDLGAGTLVHADVTPTAAVEDVYVRNGLIDMYAKCGRVEDARRVFDATRRKDVVTWNAMVAGYAQRGRGLEALDLAARMDVPPNAVTFVSLLQACAGVGAGALERGRRVHAQARRAGVHKDVAVGGSLVNMYTKCGGGGSGGDGGGLEEARRVFDELPVKNVVTWNVMLAGYAQQGRGEDALRLYDQWQLQLQCGDGGGGESSLVARPNAVTLVCVLQACASVGAPALQRGRRLHALIATTGLVDGGDDEAVVLGGSLVNMYAKCGSLDDARRVFDAIPHGKRNVVTWNAMLAGYAQHGRGREALALYFGGGGGHGQRQQEPNGVTFVCLLQACASVGAEALAQGKLLHAHIRRRAARGGALEHEEEVEVVVGGSLVHMYAKCGALAEARRMFDSLPAARRNVVTWTAMIAGYVQAGGVRNCEEALRLYGRMVAEEEGATPPPDAVTLACLLHACAGMGPPALRHGQRVHAHVEAAGWTGHAAVGSALVGMYAKCGSAGAARRAFEGLPPHCRRGVAAWTAVVAGYVEHGAPAEALQLYYHHQEQEWEPPDAAAFGWLLQACAAVGAGAAREGRDLHARIVREQGPVVVAAVGGSLVSMYARCGGARAARAVFDELPCRNVVAWNAMIAGYAQQGMAADALALYADMMQQQGQGHEEAGAAAAEPNSVTFVCLLQACAAAGALPMGRRLHAHIQRLGLLLLPDEQQAGVLGGALVNMYAKCGAMSEAQAAFDATPAARRTALTTGALMSGYTRAGDALAVLALLRQLDQPPDGPALLAALTACSHAGLVDEGRAVFAAVAAPSAAHYAAMTDLLARAGHIRDALHMARHATEASAGSTTTTATSPAAVWVTVLGACRKWGGETDAGVEVAQAAFAAAVRADALDPAAYVLMAHVYARAGMWDAARAVDRRRVDAGAWKRPGECWWAGDDGSGGGGSGEVVHRFRAGRVVGTVGWGSSSGADDDEDAYDEAEVADGGGAGQGSGLVAGVL